jgi:hypothetical protein
MVQIGGRNFVHHGEVAVVRGVYYAATATASGAGAADGGNGGSGGADMAGAIAIVLTLESGEVLVGSLWPTRAGTARSVLARDAMYGAALAPFPASSPLLPAARSAGWVWSAQFEALSVGDGGLHFGVSVAATATATATSTNTDTGMGTGTGPYTFIVRVVRAGSLAESVGGDGPTTSPSPTPLLEYSTATATSYGTLLLGADAAAALLPGGLVVHVLVRSRADTDTGEDTGTDDPDATVVALMGMVRSLPREFSGLLLPTAANGGEGEVGAATLARGWHQRRGAPAAGLLTVDHGDVVRGMRGGWSATVRTALRLAAAGSLRLRTLRHEHVATSALVNRGHIQRAAQRSRHSSYGWGSRRWR